ncbi:hypothetical protein [Nostoc sp. GT001]|nr:hypothetical protein [Nostoc sp. GT001]MDM9582144.1 hypothetical protein [Nostoc sp. GT001]
MDYSINPYISDTGFKRLGFPRLIESDGLHPALRAIALKARVMRLQC